MLLDVQDLGHRFGDRQALEGVTFELDGGTTALLGVNGSGKSTLLRALAGAQRPTSGSLRIGGYDPYQRRERIRALEQVALMPQVATLPAPMTALEVVTHIGWLRGLSMGDAGTRAHAALDQVGLSDRASARIKELSGGMQRRVALAQALVGEPGVILLDEPSTGLDPEQRRVMVDLVRELEGVTVLFSSHVIEDVLDVARRVIVLEGGRLVFDGPVEDVLTRGAAAREGAVTASERAEAGFLDLVGMARRTGWGAPAGGDDREPVGAVAESRPSAGGADGEGGGAV